MKKILQQAIDFHGHLGPFLIIGLKMGMAALEEFGLKKYSSLKVTVDSSTNPPLSCIIDGIQVATGCTLGRGTIKVNDQSIPTAHFEHQERKVIIKLKREYHKKILQELKKYTPELVAEELLKQRIDDYLTIKYEGQ